MKFSLTQQGAVTVVVLEGNLMGGPESSTLNSRVNELVDQGKTNLVIDLGQVAFMNSSGLGILITSATTLKNSGGRLTIANASEKILALLKITRLSPLFEVFPSVQAAVESFKH